MKLQSAMQISTCVVVVHCVHTHADTPATLNCTYVSTCSLQMFAAIEGGVCTGAQLNLWYHKVCQSALASVMCKFPHACMYVCMYTYTYTYV